MLQALLLFPLLLLSMQFTKEVSAQIFEAMQKAGILNAEGLQLRNPRGGEWRQAITKASVSRCCCNPVGGHKSRQHGTM